MAGVAYHFWGTVLGAYAPILFEVGISNLVYGCILGWRSVAYHFWVTDIDLDLVSRLIMSGAYLLTNNFSSNVSHARPILFGAFITLLCHLLK